MEFTKKKKGRCKRGCAAKESRNLYTTIDKELLWNICKCRRLGLKIFYTTLKKKRAYFTFPIKFVIVSVKGNSLVLHCAPSTAHNIATPEMAAVLSCEKNKQGPLLQS